MAHSCQGQGTEPAVEHCQGTGVRKAVCEDHNEGVSGQGSQTPRWRPAVAAGAETHRGQLGALGSSISATHVGTWQGGHASSGPEATVALSPGSGTGTESAQAGGRGAVTGASIPHPRAAFFTTGVCSADVDGALVTAVRRLLVCTPDTVRRERPVSVLPTLLQLHTGPPARQTCPCIPGTWPFQG